jgi:Holliday junction DNA helicase RuvA
MIASIKGEITDLANKFAVIETADGIGYQIFLTTKNIAKFKKGQNVKLLTELIVREDSQSLYGFLEKQEKEVFNLTQKVSGVGPKMAMAILDVFAPKELVLAIEQGDVSLFKQISGIGNKLAQKIILELKGQVDLNVSNISSSKNDAISGLVNLGFNKRDVADLVIKISEEQNTDDTAILIRETLKLLNKK